MFYITVIYLVVLFIILKTFAVVPNHQMVIKERLGKYEGILKPGFHFLIPFFDHLAYVHETREQVLDVASQTCITKDNIQVEVDGVVYLKVMDPKKASYGIENYRLASVNLCQTTMRAEIGKLSLDSTFSERDSINWNIVAQVDQASDAWGIKVLRYEIKNINPSSSMVATMEKQMEAERQRRAEVTMAEADKQARINSSHADRQEKINISEGERQKRINIAEGKAKEIALIAVATADSIQKISQAIGTPGGSKAVQAQILDQFIEGFGDVIKTSKIKVVPAQLANIKGFFEGISQVGDTIPETEFKEKPLQQGIVKAQRGPVKVRKGSAKGAQ